MLVQSFKNWTYKLGNCKLQPPKERSNWIFFLRDLHQSHGVGANFGPKPFCRKTSPICSVRRTWRQNGKHWRLKDLSERPPRRLLEKRSAPRSPASYQLPNLGASEFWLQLGLFFQKKRLEKMYIRYPSIGDTAIVSNPLFMYLNSEKTWRESAFPSSLARTVLPVAG